MQLFAIIPQPLGILDSPTHAGLTIKGDFKIVDSKEGAYVEAIIENTATTGVGGAAGFAFINDRQEWKMGVNTSDQFRFRDETNGNNVFIIEDGAEANSLYLGVDKVGFGTNDPDNKVHIYDPTSNELLKLESGDETAALVLEDIDDKAYVSTESQYLSLGGTQGLTASNLNIDLITGYIGAGETEPETLSEWTHAQPYLTLHNSTHENSDGGRESRIIFKGEQGVDPYPETELAMLEVSHDGTSNDQLAKMVASVNTGTGLVDIIEIDSSGNTKVGDAGVTNYTQFAIDGSQTFVGTAGLSYGGMFLHNGGVTIDCVGGNFIKITGLSSVGLLNNVTYNTSALRADVVGVYKVSWSCDADAAGANKDFEFAVHLNEVEIQQGSSHSHSAPTAHDEFTVSSSCLIDVTSTAHDIDLRVRNITDDTDIDILDVSFNIVQIGGT